MDLPPSAALAMTELAFDRMLQGAHELGDRVSERPSLPDANSVFAIVTHCIAVTEFWLGHVALGEEVARDREAEFEATGSITDLDAAVGAIRSRLPELFDLANARTELAVEHRPGHAPPWPWTPTGVVLHVIEELFQHAGHVDLTVDLLLADA